MTSMSIYTSKNPNKVFTRLASLCLCRWPMWLQNMLQKSLTSLRCLMRISNEASWGLKVNLSHFFAVILFLYPPPPKLFFFSPSVQSFFLFSPPCSSHGTPSVYKWLCYCVWLFTLLCKQISRSGIYCFCLFRVCSRGVNLQEQKQIVFITVTRWWPKHKINEIFFHTATNTEW